MKTPGKLVLISFFVAFCLDSGAQATQSSLSAPSRIGAPIDESQRVALQGNIHPLAQPRFDHGAAPATKATGRVRLILKRSGVQQQALMQYLNDLVNPSAQAYHKWMTPAQFGAAFGIGDADLETLKSWLQAHGFTIEKIPQARNMVEFSGTVGQLQSAFHTSIHLYSVAGETHFANASDPEIPAALAPVVAGVGPLTDFHPKSTFVRGPSGHFNQAQSRIEPDLTLAGNNSDYLFVDPADAATIYDTPNKILNANYTASTSYDGTGVTIGIAGVSDLTLADVANYRIAFLNETAGSVNLPTVVVDGNDPGLNGAGDEALLDTEVAGGIAPKAKIIFYTSSDSDLASGLTNALFRALDDNAVSILSLSFSECEAFSGTAGNQLDLEAAEQAAAQGITMTVSAGDSGSAGCDDFDTESAAVNGFGVNGLASTPYNVAVGGTDFDVLAQSFSTYVNTASGGAPPYYGTALKHIPELPWNDSITSNADFADNTAYFNSKGLSNIIAGGGGVSTVYTKPGFQTSFTLNDGHRDVPDVALFAGILFYRAAWLICSDNMTDGVTDETYTNCQMTAGQFTNQTTFDGAGGTSAATPAFAAMLALVAQAKGSPAGGYRLGQVDPVLYQLAQSKYATVFHDVTAGNNSVPCVSASPNCVANLFLNGYNAQGGYDLASGLGSVDVAALVNNWSSVAQASTTTTMTLNGSTAAYSGVHGALLDFGVDVTPSSATGAVAIIDTANETGNGTLNNGQLPVSLSGGAGQASYNGLPGGTYQVSAHYGGDGQHAASSSSPIQVTIAPEASTTALSIHAYNGTTGESLSNTNIPYGSVIFADAQIAGTAEGANTQGVATGSVSFTDGGTALGSSAVTSRNQASWPPGNSGPTVLSGGSYSIVARYSGDASFNASTSPARAFTIVPESTSITSQVNQAVLAAGETTYFSQTISWLANIGALPTGNVSLTANGQVIDTITQLIPTNNGIVFEGPLMAYGQISANQLSPGLNTVTSTYSGDSNYSPSSATFTVDVVAPGGGFSMNVINPITAIASLTPTTATLTITPSGGYSGYLSFSCSVTPQTAATCYVPEAFVPASGSVDVPLTIYTGSGLTPGSYTISLSGSDNVASIQGATNINLIVTAAGSPSLAVMNGGGITVAPGGAPGISFVSIVPSGGLAGQVNLSCSVSTSISNAVSQPACSIPASVTLNAVGPTLASVQVSTTAGTTPGAYLATVNAASASSPSVTTTDMVPIAVTTAPAFVLSSVNNLSMNAGADSGNGTTLTITPLNGFTGTVNLGCVAFPETETGSYSVDCNLPSPVIVSGSNPVPVQMTVSSSVNTSQGLYLLQFSATSTGSPVVSAESSLDLTVTTPVSLLTLSNSGNIQTVAGSTSGNTTTVTITPNGSYTGTVNLTCRLSTATAGSVDPPTCTILPASLTISGTTAMTSTATVYTTAPSSSSFAPTLKHPFWGGMETAFALIVWSVFPARFRNKNALRAMVVIGVVAALACGACGGGGSGGGGGGGGGGGTTGTTPGTYTMIVTGTDSANSTISAQSSFTVQVQ